jgi:hypothetical protein
VAYLYLKMEYLLLFSASCLGERNLADELQVTIVGAGLTRKLMAGRSVSPQQDLAGPSRGMAGLMTLDLNLDFARRHNQGHRCAILTS